MSNVQPLSINISDVDSTVVVRLSGTIDEENKLQASLSNATGRVVLVHLGEVHRLNSAGVRDWVRWVQALEARKNRLYFAQCSPPVIGQVNMVRNFCGASGQIVSFEAPYFCRKCNKERRRVLRSAAVTPGGEAPAETCEVCGSQLDFDDLPEIYFAFLKNHAKPMASEVDRALTRIEGGAGRANASGNRK